VETRTKERLTGALILVALLVVLIPELLSGRKAGGGAGDVPDARPASEGPPLRSYTLDLGAPAEAQLADQSALSVRPSESAGTGVPAPTPAPEPAVAAVPASAAPPAAAPESPKPAPPKPEPPRPEPPKPAAVTAAPAKAAAASTAAPSDAAKGKSWTVQVGSFAKLENAQRFVQQLTAEGFAAQLLAGSGAQLHRVRVGPAENKAAAVALQSRLAAQGHKGTLVAP
jgi:cell division septation protein DedD